MKIEIKEMEFVAENKEKMEEFSTEEAVKEAVENAEAMAEETASEKPAEEASEESSKEEKEGKKPFKKKEKKKDKRDEQIEQLTDRVTRQMAEFENFRRRTDQEKAQMFGNGQKAIVEKILPVVDNFERGLATVEEGADPFADGMLMIYKQLLTTLEEIGVKPIEAVGQEFNPDFHNAVMHVDDEEVGENIVVEEFQKGYMMNDSVVRHSMVKVAN
ncbi:molecular chaperone GrpE [Pseudobutyrivibrio sp. OR37]|uniref:nucleotide exchange factor GrpE n=1 Tax=Pseudobutyrivibrio sp. OR37 TaxID=1798186 RepID=UPI0008E49BDE|nr:nucleotide exchange factor GrpE [Pseudobutyrivibrio sp. OR37]SFH57278.1 molecular chaperone GrpE [Pseudobutyrivibrio sp. OR37]